MSEDKSTVIERIKKLLARANPNSNNFKAEMDTAMKFVQLLLAKHQLSLEDIESDDTVEEVSEFDVEAKTKISHWENLLYNTVRKLTNTDCFTRSKTTKNTKNDSGVTIKQHVIFVGFKADTALAKELIAIFKKIINKDAREYNKLNLNNFNAIQSFKYGMTEVMYQRAVDKINDGLTDAEKQKYGTLMVLKNKQIEDYLEKLSLTSTRRRYDNIDHGAYYAGRIAGQNVSLDTTGMIS